MTWNLESMRRSVALMMAKGIDPNCELVARTCGVTPEDVRREVMRKLASVPPNSVEIEGK